MSTIVLRSELKEITGDALSAMILNQLCYWSQRADRDGNWFYKSCAELVDELCGLASESTVRRRIRELISKGFLKESKDRGGSWDRTIWYQVDESAITKALRQFGKTFASFFARKKDTIRHGDGSSRHGAASRTETSDRKSSLQEVTDRQGEPRCVSSPPAAADVSTASPSRPSCSGASRPHSDDGQNGVNALTADAVELIELESRMREKVRKDRGEAQLSEFKPFPHHKPEKVEAFWKAAEQIGSKDEAWAYLSWVTKNATLDWLANFGWKDIDLHLVYCKGAIKEWRRKTGRVKANRPRNERERQIKKADYQERPEDKEVGW